MAFLTVGYLHASAQETVPINQPDYNKPKLFSDLPAKLNLRLPDMEALLNLSVGTKVNTLVAEGLQLKGTVVSRSNPDDLSVKSVVINSFTRQGATLTFTRFTKDDGTYSYIGRMISKDAGDALEIVKEGTVYVIRKTGLYDLINE